ncbi:MAG: hypothetical protein PVI06_01685 [Desulfobacterales bacterium]
MAWHWHNQKTRNLLKAKAWNYVVLQGRSGGPLEDNESMFKYARLLDAEIRNQGANTIFYMTWANRKRPESQKTLTDAYRQISRELGAILAPVGAAWEHSLRTDPHLRFHHSDDRRAGPAGAYLTGSLPCKPRLLRRGLQGSCLKQISSFREGREKNRRKVIAAIVIFVLGLWIAKILRSLARKMMTRRNVDDTIQSPICNSALAGLDQKNQFCSIVNDMVRTGLHQVFFQ